MGDQFAVLQRDFDVRHGARGMVDLLVGQCRAVDGVSNVSRNVTWHSGVHLLNGADGREDLPRRAVAALKAITVRERGLHRVKLVACGDVDTSSQRPVISADQSRSANSCACGFPYG